MNCSLEKVLADAKSLVERLRNHDNAAEMLIEQTTSLNKRVEAMQQVKSARPVLPVGFSCPLLDQRIKETQRGCPLTVPRGDRHAEPGRETSSTF